MNIGVRIKELRKKEGLNQIEFCKKIKLSQGRLSEIEQGKNNPSYDTLLAIKENFDISLDWLVTGLYPKSDKTYINNSSVETDKHNYNEEEYQLFKLFNECNQEHKAEIINNIKRFMSDSNYKFNNSIDNLTDEELKVLNLFRELNSIDKIKIEGIIESKLLEAEESKKEISSQYLSGEESAAKDGIA